MRYLVQVRFCSGRVSEFDITLADDFNVEKDMGQHLTRDRPDILVCDNGAIVAIPFANVEYIRYLPVEDPASE